MISFGLTAGLSYSEMRRMPPGQIIDLYFYRQAYDDQQHGIRREKEKIYD